MVSEERLKELDSLPDYSPEDIKRIRFAEGLTQIELANKLKVSEVTVRNWEHGKMEPSAQSKELIKSEFSPIPDVRVPEDWTAADDSNKQGQKQQYNCRLPANIARFIDAYADEMEQSRSAAMRQLLILGIESIDYNPFTMTEDFDDLKVRVIEEMQATVRQESSDQDGDD